MELREKYIRLHKAVMREVKHLRTRDWATLTNNEKITKVSLEKVVKELADEE